MYNHITDIFFDLDHTLWDFETNSALAFKAILNQHHPTINAEEFAKVYSPINHAYWKLYQKDKVTQNELRYNRLRDSFRQINYEITTIQIEEISNLYIEHLPTYTHLFEDAVEVLTYLNKKYKLHIITNGFEEVQIKKLKNTKIDHFFDTITNSQLAGAKKPNPIIYEYALQAAKTEKYKSIMIGDCLDADIQGAIDFGMDAIFFNPNPIEIPKNINQITTLAALKKIF